MELKKSKDYLNAHDKEFLSPPSMKMATEYVIYFFLVYTRFFAFIRDHTPIFGKYFHGKGVVLDVGCGNKPYRNYFSGDISKYIGLNLENHQEVDVVGDAIYLPILDHTIDTVLCFNALNVFRNPIVTPKIWTGQFGAC